MSTNDEKHRLGLYMRDIGFVLKKEAREAKAQHLAAVAPEDKSYESGRCMAYYEVIYTMQMQAIAFNIPFEVLNLADIDPDKDLL